jgi:hypothetical protein
VTTKGALFRFKSVTATFLGAALLTAAAAGVASADPFTSAQWQFINDFAHYFPPTATPPEVLSLATATCQMVRRGERAVDMFHDLRSAVGPIDDHIAASIIAESIEAQCPDKIGYIG